MDPQRQDLAHRPSPPLQGCDSIVTIDLSVVAVINASVNLPSAAARLHLARWWRGDFGRYLPIPSPPSTPATV
ncbi:MAG: hypothetical protein IPI41_12070 [Flavobacteriales bacterium]|nr:hypothetical protein [Flavobacteriales bacterium]